MNPRDTQMDACDPVDNKEANHSRLQSAIRIMNESINYLEKLRADIYNEPPITGKDAKEIQFFSLSSVLKEAPDEIRAVAGRINELIEQIRAALF